ncbi:hypothetical protein OGAPHI_005591 [Ogataea philodendri]|uniref:Sucrose transporter n=1 Tax=Ogataea philodendri TaxID=1378263 RepID=A0A9P8P0C3_9ASCO|nr:uncharacterized protein OGAPHI_005591 [Ogataea philodendri]KAH3662339.1 hypothetical protein OGAPHI_005591 [Ogataea philodendri]
MTEQSTEGPIDNENLLDQSLSLTLDPEYEQEMSDLYNPIRSTGYIMLLTLIVGALQLAWSTEFSEATPFLLSLGVSKHSLALIWLAGPLSGTFGQPIVGLLSDQCNVNWGRRRPFIMGGCLATIVSLLYLSHSTNIIGWFVKDKDPDVINGYTVPFAAAGIYVLDFSIAVIQASCRALIVDVVPSVQQQIANAWAARMIGGFNIVGFWLGTLELSSLFPWLGNSQFKVLSWLVAIIMLALTSISVFVIKEKNPRYDVAIRLERKKTERRLKDMGVDQEHATIFTAVKSFFWQVLRSIRRLPQQVKIVCYAEFFAWIGYFPMLFYTSTYVGELYLYENGYNNPLNLPPDERQKLLDEGVRRGTLALLVHAVVTLAVDLVLPTLVEKLKNHRFINMRQLWIYSHVVFIVSTLSTFFISTSVQAIVLFGFLGIPWGCAVWIPFALISEEIARIKDIKAIQIYDEQRKQNRPVSADSDRTLFDPDSDFYTSRIMVAKYDHVVYDSGILLAIHNVFVSAPQMVSSLGSSLVFKLFQSDDKDAFDNSLGWIFRLGGIICIGALILSYQVKTNTQLYNEDKEESLTLVE